MAKEEEGRCSRKTRVDLDVDGTGGALFFYPGRFERRIVGRVGFGEDIPYLADQPIGLTGFFHGQLHERPKVLASIDSCID